MSAQFGAAPSEWAHFVALGLAADLLPVVSNPTAEISPQSKMKGLGKTPSKYNGSGKAVGIPAWTEHQASAAEIKRWSADGDLGICIQTRQVRAIDIDIADPARAQRVRDAINMIVGDLPARVRSNSGKCLLVFQLPGEYSKRILRCEHGIVEFLATGQQFIAVGEHFNATGPSGARYEWEGGLPADIPYLSRDTFEELWTALAATFAISVQENRAPGAKPTAPRKAGDGAGDPVLAFLEAKGWVQSIDNQGRAHITCPWEHEHSDGKNGAESATTYFPASSGGFQQGHFRCLHAHCDHRTDGDFLEATGYAADGFEVVEVKPGEVAPIALPKFKRDKRTEKILATIDNVLLALGRPDVCGWHIAFDMFTADLMRAPVGTTEWVKFRDGDYTRLRRVLAKGGFEEVGRELMRDAVVVIAEEAQFDSAIVWLKGVGAWDGTPRIERFWSTYCKTADNAYTRACGNYTWSALAGRVLSPGCQVDMVPVLVGKQGTRKTSAVKAMAPSRETFVELSMDIHDVDLARKMRGKLVAELGELRGLAGKDSDAIKQWITRTTEEWTPKYKEFGTSFARRLLMIGTTNRDEILVDDDGEERRWLPMRVLDTIDVDAITRDRDQLWAEGALLFERNGVVFADAEELAKGVHAEFRASDLWHGAITRWLDEVEFGAPSGARKRRDGAFKMADLMQGALNMDVKHLQRKDELRTGKILRVMGFDKVTLRRGTHDGCPREVFWALAENCAWGQALLADDFSEMA